MDKALRYLALGRKAGGVVLGEDRCCEAAELGRLKLLLLPSDVSEHTERRANRALEGRRAPLRRLPWKRKELSSLLGGGSAMVGFTDRGLAAAFAESMRESDSDWEETASLLEYRREKALRRKAAPRKRKNGERGGSPHGN